MGREGRMISLKFSEQIHAAIEPVWQRCYEHTFLRGLANGTLPIDKFQFYILQDNQYLEAFINLHKALADKMPTKEMAEPLLKVLEPGNNEIVNRRKVVDAVKITDDQVASTTLAPVATAYINHMYYQAYFVSPSAGVASLLPCYWSYAECFKRMAEAGPHTTPTYQAFINLYTSDHFQTGSANLVKLVDQLAERGDDQTRRQMQHAFNLSSDYELMYWSMAYDRQQWPHQRFPKIG